MNSEPEIGDKIRFIPCANTDHSAGFGEVLLTEITGTIVQIHAEHRWFRCAYERGGVQGFECFKY